MSDHEFCEDGCGLLGKHDFCVVRSKSVSDALEDLNSICRYAYDNGLHEIGYTPQDELGAEIDNMQALLKEAFKYVGMSELQRDDHWREMSNWKLRVSRLLGIDYE